MIDLLHADLRDLPDPNIEEGSVEQTPDGFYYWRCANGVEVFSVEPPVKRAWWDTEPAHLIWSYASWGTLILSDNYACPWPRRWLKNRGWW